MSDRRHWTEDEKQKLIELVQKNYEYLTAALTPSKTKVMVKKRWKEITDEINSLADGVALTVLQVQRKWSDEKSNAKKAVTKYHKEAGKTGGGRNTVDTPTEFQAKIVSFIGNAV